MRAATLTNFDIEKRTVRLSFASETPIRDYWYGKEILRVSDSSMNTERFSAGVMPVLFNHERDKVIGRVDKIWTEAGKGYADITFDDDELSERILRKVESGSLRGVSVGYNIQNYSIIERDETSTDGIEGPALIADRWEVFEISIVSIPADAAVGVGRSRLYSPDVYCNLYNFAGFHNMGDGAGTEEAGETEVEKPNPDGGERSAELQEEKNNDEGEEKEMTPEERAALAAEVRTAENQRQSNIRALCRELKIEEKDMEAMLKDENCTMEKANERALAILKERMKPTAPPKVTVTQDQADKKRTAIVDGLFLRHGGTLEKPADGADEFRNCRFTDVARMVLQDAGETGIGRMTERELFKRALTTTSALSAIADNLAHKSLSGGYNEVATTYGAWTQTGSNTDFKIAKRYRIYDAMAPVKIPEGGEFSYSELLDESVGVQLATYGDATNFTREMMINDDLNVLVKIPALLRTSMERYKNHLAYKALIDANNYSSAKGNLGTAAALSVKSLGEAKKLMRKQKLGNNTVLNIVPKYLIIPAALETVAEQLLTSTADPEGKNSGVSNPANRTRSNLELIVDATLDELSGETAYYLVATKGMVDTIEVCYLNGNASPIIETGTDFNNLGINFRMYHDFAINVLDTRGLVKNAGK